MSVHMCAWCPVMDWHPIKGVFQLHVQCCQDGLQIHYNPDQDNMLTEDEFINIIHEKTQTQSDGTCSVQIQDLNLLAANPSIYKPNTNSF